MTKTRWGSDLVPVPQMDREHLDLISRVNGFLAAVDAQQPRVEIEMRLTQLMESFEDHFASEESLMQLNNYPAMTAHANEHRELIAQMNELRDDLREGIVNACPALILFVRVWTELHITGMDRGLAHFLQRESRSEPRLSSVAT